MGEGGGGCSQTPLVGTHAYPITCYYHPATIPHNSKSCMKPWGDREMGTAAISCTKCSQVAGLIHTVGRNIPGRCGQVAGLIQRSVKVLQRHRLFVQLPFIQNLICHMLLMRNAHLIYCAVLHDYCTVKSMYVRRTSFSETAKLAKTGT